MNWNHSGFFWALFTLIIPVAIHLFHFRKFRKVYFPSIRFLQEIELVSKKQRNLRKYLVLASRMLAITCLVMAFAMPFFASKQSPSEVQKKFYSLYIDNSASMGLKGKEGVHFQYAREQAVDFVKSCSEKDIFQVLSNDLNGEAQRLLTREEALQKLDALGQGVFNASLNDIQLRQKEAWNRAGKTSPIFLYFSDFQKIPDGWTTFQPDSGITHLYIPANRYEVSNVSIDSVWLTTPFAAPGTPIQLKVQISVSGNSPVENGSVSLQIDQNEKAVSSFKCDANSKTTSDVVFSISEPGFHSCVLKIVDQNIPFDDELYFTLDLGSGIQVSVAGGSSASSFFIKGFQVEPFIKLKTMEDVRMDFNEIRKSRLLVIEPQHTFSSGEMLEINNMVSEGGNLILALPNRVEHLNPWKEWLQKMGIEVGSVLRKQRLQVSQIQLNHPLLSEVIEKDKRNLTLPQVQQSYSVIAGKSTTATSVMNFENGESFLLEIPFQKGKIFLLSTAMIPEFTDFYDHPLFVPFLLKVAFNSRIAWPLMGRIGSETPWRIPASLMESTHDIILAKGEKTFVPEVFRQGGFVLFSIPKEIMESGHYQVLSGKTALPGNPLLALNYPLFEGHMQFFNAEEMQKKKKGKDRILSTTGTQVSQMLSFNETGTSLWPLFVAASLIFLLIETLLIRFFVNNDR